MFNIILIGNVNNTHIYPYSVCVILYRIKQKILLHILYIIITKKNRTVKLLCFYINYIAILWHRY